VIAIESSSARADHEHEHEHEDKVGTEAYLVGNVVDRFLAGLAKTPDDPKVHRGSDIAEILFANVPAAAEKHAPDDVPCLIEQQSLGGPFACTARPRP
jgi:hypothetical protein